jgi:hypothetical protein
MPQDNVYILVNDEEQGPFDLDALRSKLATGEITGETLYAAPGMSDWRPLAEILDPQDAPMVEMQPTGMPEPEPKKRGFIQRLIDNHREAKQRAANLQAFKAELLSAARDGVLTDDEAEMLSRQKLELGIQDADFEKWKIEVYKAAVQGALSDGAIKPAKEAELARIQTFLGICQAEIPIWLFNTIFRSKLLYSLRNEPLIPLTIPNLLLAKDETAFWQEPGSIYEERVVASGYQGGSTGVSIRVAKGVSFRVGSHRGQLVKQTADVAVSAGSLVITNQRLIFIGDRKSFSAKWDKIVSLEPAIDGLRFSESNRQKPRLVLFASRNGDLVCEVLSKLVDPT